MLCLLALHSAASYKQEMDGNLFRVYGVDFSHFIKNNPVSLVALHNNSTFSQQVVKTLHELERKFLSENIPIKVARMAVREASSYLNLWHVKHVPHIRLYIGEEVYDDFRAYPSLDNIFTWAIRVLDSPDKITLIDSEAKVAQFQKEPFAFYLRFPAEQTFFIDLLRKFQKLDRSLKVYYTNKPAYDVFESHNPKDVVVGFKRPFDDGDKFLASEKKLNQGAVRNFFELFRHPEIHQLNEELIRKLKEKRPRAIILFDAGERTPLLEQFAKAAAFHKLNIMFIRASVGQPETRELAELARVDKSGLPVIRIVDTVEDHQRVFEVVGQTAAEIGESLERYAKGELVDLLAEEIDESL